MGNKCGYINILLNIVLFTNTFLTSCINGIPEEETYQSSDIPISINFIPNGVNNINIDESFKSDDRIGLYLIIQPATLKNTRYIDNMCYTYSSKGFTPSETTFFPEGSNTCDFLAYYPYQNNGFAKGGTGINVKVATDQSNLTRFYESDFMIASAKGIVATDAAIALKFDHKLFYYDIQLKVESGYTLESLLNANPEIKIKDVYTQATYDYASNSFINPSAKSDIIPYGEWTIKDDRLCGKRAFIIPQTITESHIIIELYVDGKIYDCSYSKEYTLVSGRIEENTITLQSSGEAPIIEVSTSFSEWDEAQSAMEARERGSSIPVGKLDFTGSNVLKVMNGDTQVAEICKEYLCGDGIDTTAIVIYPMANQKSDLTKGVVLEVIGEAGDKHGGSISWDSTGNQFDYTEGTSPVLSYFFITSEGEIRTSRPVNALQIDVKTDIISDVRGTESIEYPIIKIGTQYWMRVNCRSTKYTDGTDIGDGGTTVNSKIAQYYHYSNSYFFYNAAAIATGKLTPNGWRIGNETDYTLLKTYIKNNASALKNGSSWKNVSSGVTNLTGFNAVATGYFKPTYLYNREYAAYWCANNNSSNEVDKMVSLSTDDNDIKFGSATGEVALSLKCIRE